MLVSSRPLRRSTLWVLVQASLVSLFIVSAGHAGSLPATASAAFSPATVMVGGSQTTTYTLTVANPNVADLTNVQFTNAYPAGLVADVIGNYTCATSNVLNPPGNPGGTNGGSGTFTATGFSFTLNTLSAGTSCTVVLNMHATSQGSLVDTTSTFTSNESSAGAAASATLTVNPSTPVTLQAFDVE
jgi:uncharacterized repeat protein (TIGR01451 family)